MSYNQKHNEENGEGNRDGMGREPLVELRPRRRDDQRGRAGSAECARPKNILATLMLSQGLPMLMAGDEFLRTQ